MARVTLDEPLTLDPQQATRLEIRSAQIDFDARVVIIQVDLVGANGRTLARREVTADGAQVQTWINNQESTIYQRLLAKLGVTGTIG